MFSIYTVMVFEKLDIDRGFPNFGNSRVVGFYTKEEDALNAVKNNACDINERCYDYALVEKYNEGLYNVDYHYNRKLFKYDIKTDTYNEIDFPWELLMFVSFALS